MSTEQNKVSEPSSAESAATAPAPRPKGLLIASILCWLYGIILGVFSIGFVISEIPRDNPMAILGLVWLFPAIPYCLAGYWLRKGRRLGGWIAVLTAALLSAILLLSGGGFSILVLGNLAIMLV